jgi:hypothetical protein
MSQSLDNLIQMLGAVSAVSGIAGSGSALVVDFFRRRVRAKASEYAAQSDFSRIGNAVAMLQSTIDKHVVTSASQHSELCQRVARLEGKHDA